MEVVLTDEAKKNLVKIDELTKVYHEFLQGPVFDQTDFALNTAVVKLGELHYWAKNSLIKKEATAKQ